jgi:hypothetical protein
MARAGTQATFISCRGMQGAEENCGQTRSRPFQLALRVLWQANCCASCDAWGACAARAAAGQCLFEWLPRNFFFLVSRFEPAGLVKIIARA